MMQSPQLQQQIFDSIQAVGPPGAWSRPDLSGQEWSGMWPTGHGVHLLPAQQGVARHVHLPPAVINVPARRFAHLSIDLVRPLPVFSGLHPHPHDGRRDNPLGRLSCNQPRQLTVPLVRVRLGGVLWCARRANLGQKRAQFTSAIWGAQYTRLGMVQRLNTAFRPRSNS